uniref:Coenzyme f420-dependent n5,n10-methylene tetrahydromethanopterin reductase and related flavin-dependent oxidoreductases n=1 Tax=uncultured Chloroflexi bacterium HF0200_06I16 TaxID=710735 RepID=E0XTX9_9CHLR|nr:coenzyme f420-dependent n5,n10-methylene tetrahydromethanopterin reductase and related flavin-dependent oxidoreductases [uncultured Chloroflexi bacterium HF0200_06I16]
MTTPKRMKFGVFMAPFHRVGENPTLALERDLELLQWLDTLGFDEAYIGEHHSAGWETIASPELFMATAAERTRHIRLGTGVTSLPYHHPFMVANRMVQLDHLTRGRVILGCGPGALASDALMLGIKPERQRAMMEESLDSIIRLMSDTEPYSVKTDWFEMNDAVLQLRPYQDPIVPVAVASVESPAGVTLAGKHGASVLSLSVPRDTIRKTSLAELWSIAEETAAEHGKVMHRKDWGVVMGMHLADSKEQAFKDIREGAGNVVTEYFGRTLGNEVPDVPRDQIVDYMVDHNQWIVGTPDDCIAGIERLQELTGGFGKFMMRVEDWAPRDKIHRSYELLARYVMPHFQGSLQGIQTSNEWASERRDSLQANRYVGIKAATDRFDASRN